MAARGWLPPQAPGGGPPPRFETVPPEPELVAGATAGGDPAGAGEAAAGEPGATAASRVAPPGWAPPSAGTPPAPLARPVGGAPAPTGAGQPTFVRADTAPTARSAYAVVSIVLGVAAMVLLLFSLGLSFFLSLLLAVTSWVCGVRARTQARAASPPTSESQARVGIGFGIAGVALSVIAMIVWLVLFASGFSLTDLQRELDGLERDVQQQQRELDRA